MALPYLTRTTNAGQHLASATSEADGVPTVTVIAPSNPYDDHSSGSAVSKIVPGILIAFFCFTTVCLAYGLMRARRRRRDRMTLSESSSRSLSGVEPPKQKKKKRFTKPKLYDVEVKGSLWETDLEALRPVAVELQADPWPVSNTPQAQKDRQRRWFNFTNGHKPPVHQAQATFMVSMPTPNRRQGEPSKEIALGTALVPYVDDESDDDESSAIPQLLDAYPC
ncbi:hypothetical protein BDY19DRAFT_773522 [Irpex rosettiformis]|uniref:Uncharacterized protein n=1 Tax=Irpex rosettiformis TaxID=378272 RepID=A0ACB8U899_9APHY|nr:hypothetical protein BDY19DRAFT_773522 [Irpex rosettiformis]